MAYPPPPPPPPPPPGHTTISALSDDLLRAIFIRLPSIVSLARAAFSCRTFLGAVRSSPTFRRSFRELHAPPLVALFLPPQMKAVVPADTGTPRSDPDITTAFADLLQDDDASQWLVDSDDPYSYRHICFINRITQQTAYYNPHSEALTIDPNRPYNRSHLEFHTLYPDGEEQQPSRVVCVHHEQSWARARVAVFSTDTMEWQALPETGYPLLEGNSSTFDMVMVVSRFICWVPTKESCILALSTATFQFIRMDLPPPVKAGPIPTFKLGQTRDGKLCIVDVHECNLSVWLWTADDDGVEKFMPHRVFPLHTFVVVDGSDDISEVQLMAVINGFVYLSVLKKPQSSECFLSFCLETAEVNVLLKESHPFPYPVDPYIMTRWPSSLINNMDSEIEDHDPVGTRGTSPVLLTSLHSFKETLIDDDNVNFVGIDAFLLDDDKNSLVDRITTLEAGLATARGCVLRIGADSDNKKVGKELVANVGVKTGKSLFPILDMLILASPLP